MALKWDLESGLSPKRRSLAEAAEPTPGQLDSGGLSPVAARNKTGTAPAFSLQLTRVYWKAGDSAAATRDWGFVMAELVRIKKGDSFARWAEASASG